PEQVSSICAVLAETDVINMVSRGISTANILKGIHQSMAGRYVKLLRAIGAADADVLITGGLAADTGLAAVMREAAESDGYGMTIHTHPDSIYAGALGAALWGGFRHRFLERREHAPAAKELSHESAAG
ncbi:MAG: BadF/BadG/BcrA/BcrD ATPase family protein, partial [Thermoanaerobaculia bacterium]|nr:BadF/BadG/BcrA/BcrD ATPase family protein [Thermoanaerobaculia bacterium]